MPEDLRAFASLFIPEPCGSVSAPCQEAKALPIEDGACDAINKPFHPAELVARVARYEAQFLGREVPRPEFWGGYRLTPRRIEIWHNQLYRLHDRFVYRATSNGWERQRLYP